MNYWLVFGFIPLVMMVGLAKYSLDAWHGEWPEKQKPILTENVSPTAEPLFSIRESARYGWKTFATSDYEISYPESWVYDPSFKGLNAVNGSEGFVIISPDYEWHPVGYPANGGTISFSLMREAVSQTGEKEPIYDDKNDASKKAVRWLGHDAILRDVRYESRVIILTTTFDGISYSLHMSPSSQEFVDQNMDLFLEIANSIKLK